MNGFAGWTFRSFVSDDGGSIVDEWYAKQVPDVQAEFDTALEYLRAQPPGRWVRPYTGKLTGECSGLVEIIFKVMNVQYRPLGFYGPLRFEFTILLFAIERGRRFDPPNACATSLGRKTLVLENRERSREWNF